MVAETVTHPKTSRKRHGLKKVFSVPVGKLRSKIVCPGRNGSSSISGSRSASHHKILLRNNRELARALSNEKERFRGMVTENVNLKARLHETRLEVHGLENKLSGSRQSLSVYQNAIMSHLRDAVKHSVSLTESLKQAMGLCFHEANESSIRSAVSGCSITSISQPQRLRVNPMVGGLTIRHPTISLKRVVMASDNRTADTNLALNEQQFLETNDDDSQSIDETRERPGGLSTCLEEDEDCTADTNPIELADEEEESEEDDSIRRKVVSFRNTNLEKDKNTSELEVEKSSSSNKSIAHQTVESSCVEQGTTQNCKVAKSYKQPRILEKLHLPDYLSRRNPVVALNDISRFLQNSNSVNVQQVILDIDKSKLVGGGALEGSANEKENCPKPVTMKNAVLKQPCVSTRMDSRPLKGSNEMCIEGNIGINNLPDNEKRSTVRNNDVVQAVSVPQIEEDPLEGTSWMHLHLFTEKEMWTKKGGSKNRSKETCVKTSESKKLKGSSGKIVNSSKEKISDISEAQEDSEIYVNSMKAPVDDYDVSDFDNGIKNCPIAQSTPMNHGKPSENSSVSSAPDVSKFSSKSCRDSHCNNTSVSSGNNCSQVKDGEKTLVVPVVDTKLDNKAFVTVRVKRLELPDLSPVNNLAVNPPEVDDVAVAISDEEVEFLGFGVGCEVAENLMVMKKIMVSENELGPRDACGSSTTAGNNPSMWSASVTHDSGTSIDSGSYANEASACENGRPRRRAAPKELKEPGLNKKLRQSIVKKPKKKPKKLGGTPA